MKVRRIILIGLSIVASYAFGFITCILYTNSKYLFTINPPVELTGDLDLEKDYFFEETPKLKGVLGSGDSVYLLNTKGGAVYISVPTVVSSESFDKATKN